MVLFSPSQASDCCIKANFIRQATNAYRKGAHFESRGIHQSFQCIIQQDKKNQLAICRNTSPKRWRKSVTIKNQLEPSVSKKSVDTDVVTSSVEVDAFVGKDHAASDVHFQSDLDDVSGSGGSFGKGNGKFPPGGGSGGGGDDHVNDEDEEAAEYGPILKFEEVIRETEARGVNLPADMLNAAKSIGIRKMFLENYLNLQGAAWPLGYGVRTCSLLRNRMLVDQHFLFKIGTEIVIDSCCATFAEVQKRGKDFWSEFELYAADLLVGVVVNVALVGMLAPYARIGQPSTSNGLLSRMGRAYNALPSSVFEAERPGCRFSAKQRAGTYFYKGLMYGAVGFACGIIGQGIANLIMAAKRSVNKSEEDIAIPPLVKTAALWGVFLGVSSNTRYQIINGLERLVEASPVAKRIPAVSLAFTVGVRFSNNIYGGMQFVDWARWTGCQ